MGNIYAQHGMSNNKVYNVWRQMRQRCSNKNNKYYYIYGGKGVRVCDAWENDFICFYKWAMANGYKKGLTLDRIETDGNYEPNNCRWVDVKANSNNKNNNLALTINGETKTLKQWAEHYGVDYANVYYRYKTGHSIEEVFTHKSLKGNAEIKVIVGGKGDE
jgi:hypothetical protein